MNKRTFVTTLAVVGTLLGGVSIASANHAWGNYHWERSVSSMTIVLGDNVTTAWDAYLSTSSTDWSISTVLNTQVVPGLSPLKNCKPVAGRIEICNSKYGSNGWLGIASVWVVGDHIIQGTVKMNDTYFNSRTHNTPAWRNLVMCQEIGHTLGLDHQDEVNTNANLDTCMDYSNSPTSNQHPNLHDYEMLETIYAHLDGASTTPAVVTQNGASQSMNDASEWGTEIRRSKNGQASVYKRELRNGGHVLTHIFWVSPRQHTHH